MPWAFAQSRYGFSKILSRLLVLLMSLGLPRATSFRDCVRCLRERCLRCRVGLSQHLLDCSGGQQINIKLHLFSLALEMRIARRLLEGRYEGFFPICRDI